MMFLEMGRAVGAFVVFLEHVQWMIGRVARIPLSQGARTTWTVFDLFRSLTTVSRTSAAGFVA